MPQVYVWPAASWCAGLASASLRTRSKMATMAAANLLAGLKGERLPHCANPEVYGS